MIQKLIVNRPTIFADYREKDVIELLKQNRKIKVVEDNLDVDFIIADIGIERKTINDFVNSIFDKRIFEQLEKESNFKKFIIIVEGRSIYLNEEKREIFYGMLSKIIATKNVSIIFTEDIFETVNILEKISEKYSSGFVTLPKTKVRKKKKEIDKAAVSVLAAFPGISYKTAERILKTFKSIKNFVNAEKHKLVGILGEKRAEKILKIINYEFKD